MSVEPQLHQLCDTQYHQEHHALLPERKHAQALLPASRVNSRERCKSERTGFILSPKRR